MGSSFEWFVAGRYLRARRKEKVVSVVTVISVLGVAAGVMALVISLAVNNGFRDTLENDLLKATAHVNVLKKDTGTGITNWRELTAKMRTIPHVVAAAPVLYGKVFITGPQSGNVVVLKGIEVKSELETSEVLRHLKSGSLDGLSPGAGSLPGLIIGSKVAEDTGLSLNSQVNVISPQGTLTPFGPAPRSQRFKVVGVFESGFYNFDDAWTYASLDAVQKLLSVGDVVNDIEIRGDNPDRAEQIGAAAEKIAGNQYEARNWEEDNAQLFDALNMERHVTFITIGLIELVAALNIVIALTMIVLTKFRDIAVLMSMGARRAQIRRIFILQGTMIGAAGTVIGLIVGYTFCYFAQNYHWIPLNESIYAVSFVPFEPRPTDGIWIAAAAMTVSLLATIYPARNATRITPVEVLRYE
ncbi:MAG TPA: ABC transporter permease [Bryobacteraceae bacterium]|nr:ABC transporter permease [Bryobacteraceae bacterium]